MEKLDQEAKLQRLENAVYDFFQKKNAGTINPFDKKLDELERNSCLERLGNRLGFRYAKATLNNFAVNCDQQRKVIDRLKVFQREMPKHLQNSGGLLLYGPPGTGKDHLLAALLKIAVAGHSLSVEWFDGGELFDEIYFAIKSDSETPLKELGKRMRKPHILAISDPQPPQGELSDSQIRRLRDVIDARYRAGLSTWITTNLDKRPDAVAILTEPVLQRLKEGSGIIDCNWQSYRETVKAEW